MKRISEFSCLGFLSNFDFNWLSQSRILYSHLELVNYARLKKQKSQVDMYYNKHNRHIPKCLLTLMHMIACILGYIKYEIGWKWNPYTISFFLILQRLDSLVSSSFILWSIICTYSMDLYVRTVICWLTSGNKLGAGKHITKSLDLA